MNITTAVGNLDELQFDEAPRTVVSLAPALTESLFELNVGSRLVGITADCIYPADKVEMVRRVGAARQPDIRLICDLRPDLVMADGDVNRPEDIQSLQAVGLKVWFSSAASVRQAIDRLWALIRLFHVPPMGQRLAVLETVYEWTSLAAEQTEPRPIFCPAGRGVSGSSTQPNQPAEISGEWFAPCVTQYTRDLLRLCGGTDIFAGGTDGQAVAAAAVAERRPEVILLPSGAGYPFTDADLEMWSNWPQIPAVENGRIYLVDGSLLTWSGTRLALALSELPSLIQT